MWENKNILVGIAGGTGSGKTTLVNEVIRMLGGDVALIPSDAYYHDRSTLEYEERKKINYDHPEAIEAELLARHLEMLKRDEPIERPMYDYVTHTRRKDTVHVDATEIIILEGILIYAIPAIKNLVDIRIYVDTDSDERLIRRIVRDVMERGRTYEDAMEQWRETVAPMHSLYVESSKKEAHIIVPHGYNEIAVAMIVAFLQKFRSDRQKSMQNKHQA
ncbi:MAG: uridine kinase [Candidatus Eremiobacteraeota bacterium]|nr:uridine kinase [Candidatus Eremiobacteraeota bacterium]